MLLTYLHVPVDVILHIYSHRLCSCHTCMCLLMLFSIYIHIGYALVIPACVLAWHALARARSHTHVLTHARTHARTPPPPHAHIHARTELSRGILTYRQAPNIGLGHLCSLEERRPKKRFGVCHLTCEFKMLENKARSVSFSM